mmetsp:Transcript_18395/g.27406  ORF Transcript_18395/g.27406 Transcript_18395/m.27406 type:complete len:266 (+) Transcript_18395:1104-1901(+)
MAQSVCSSAKWKKMMRLIWCISSKRPKMSPSAVHPFLALNFGLSCICLPLSALLALPTKRLLLLMLLLLALLVLLHASVVALLLKSLLWYVAPVVVLVQRRKLLALQTSSNNWPMLAHKSANARQRPNKSLKSTMNSRSLTVHSPLLTTPSTLSNSHALLLLLLLLWLHQLWSRSVLRLLLPRSNVRLLHQRLPPMPMLHITWMSSPLCLVATHGRFFHLHMLPHHQRHRVLPSQILSYHWQVLKLLFLLLLRLRPCPILYLVVA